VRVVKKDTPNVVETADFIDETSIWAWRVANSIDKKDWDFGASSVNKVGHLVEDCTLGVWQPFR
jgi:hypothetical protein